MYTCIICNTHFNNINIYIYPKPHTQTKPWFWRETLHISLRAALEGMVIQVCFHVKRLCRYLVHQLGIYQPPWQVGDIPVPLSTLWPKITCDLAVHMFTSTIKKFANAHMVCAQN